MWWWVMHIYYKVEKAWEIFGVQEPARKAFDLQEHI